jgi:hypothetical protein
MNLAKNVWTEKNYNYVIANAILSCSRLNIARSMTNSWKIKKIKHLKLLINTIKFSRVLRNISYGGKAPADTWNTTPTVLIRNY